MKGLLFTLILFSTSLFAGDSGLYFNAFETGEGMSCARDGNRMSCFIFTYGDFGCDKYEDFDVADGCEFNGTRWFFTSGDEINAAEDEVQGLLFTGHGINYPFGEPRLDNPFVTEVGEAVAIGYYRLTRWDSGWIMIVERIGTFLPEHDILYTRNFEFTDLLMKATD